ncbi:MAG: hypothetical protein AAF757_23760, partial [Cyanobacteria bacterium P01_D01_bin.116]
MFPIINYQLPITNYQLSITNSQFPIPNSQFPIPNYQLFMNISPPKGKLRIGWQGFFSVFMYIVMYLPIAVLAFYSFNQS